MSEQLFEQKATPEAPQNPATNGNALNDLLSSIKNEQGQQKYNSIEDALKGLQHAQGYIQEVKQERNTFMTQLKAKEEEASRVQELERIVADLTQRQEQSAKKPDAPKFDEESISNLVKNQLASARQEEQQASNRTLVRKALVDKLGEEKAAELFNHKADELGFSPERLTQLASENPKAVLAMLGVNGEGAPKQPKFSPSSPSVRTDGVPQRRESLIGNKDAFKLPVGHTADDLMAMKQKADQLLEELNEHGISVDDLTDPKNYFKIFR